MEVSSAQESEISAFKASYHGNVRVIKGVGDFSHVVTVQPPDQDLYCKLQMTGDYPSCSPTISIRSGVLPDDLAVDLTSELEVKAKRCVGQPVIGALIKALEKWVRDKDIDLTPHVELKEAGKQRGKGKRWSKGNRTKQRAEEDPMEKKASMKTAADVIKRLQWDQSLPAEDFVVGYIDRFTGIQEQAFTSFSWEDLASVDQFALAIPQHRIQYFRYKTEKVWDKNERLDNVFGSTGSKKTITDVIRKYEEKQLETGEVAEEGQGHDAEDDFQEDTAKLSIDEPEAVRISRESQKKADYFLTLRVTDEEIKGKCEDIQKALCGHFPHFAPHVVASSGFHLTLSLLCLETDTNIAKCVNVLNKMSSKLAQLASHSKPLEVVGVDHFYGTVIYAKVKYSPEFLKFVDTIKSTLYNEGLNIHTDHGFNPHITLFKVPRAASRNRTWPREPPCLTPFSSTQFGTQDVDNLHLCQMGTFNGSNDFYTCAVSYNFSE